MLCITLLRFIISAHLLPLAGKSRIMVRAMIYWVPSAVLLH